MGVEIVYMQCQIKYWLKTRVLQTDGIPASTQVLMQIIFASIYYHFKYLKFNLQNEYRLRAIPFLYNIAQDFLDCTFIAYLWNRSECTHKVTGVPPHILLISKIDELIHTFQVLHVDIHEFFDGIVDTRGVGGSKYCANQILKDIEYTTNALSITMTIPTNTVCNVVSEESCSEPEAIVLFDEYNDILSAIEVNSNGDCPEIQNIVQHICRLNTKKLKQQRTLTI